MKNFIIGMVMIVSMSGLCFGGDCANGRCNLNRRHVQSVVSSPAVVRSQQPVRSNVRMSTRRAARIVR